MCVMQATLLVEKVRLSWYPSDISCLEDAELEASVLCNREVRSRAEQFLLSRLQPRPGQS